MKGLTTEREAEKKRRTYRREFVQSLFDSIAHRYDILNHLLSGGIDILWRKRAVRLLSTFQPQRVLDIATGTGDFAIETALSLNAVVVGIDISKKMLERAEEKIAKRGLEKTITLIEGAAESLPYTPESFDAVTVAFGVRNFENMEQGLSEMFRVLKRGGTAVILEFSQPVSFPMKQVYGFYKNTIIPFLGGIVSRNKNAYSYLPATIGEFPFGEEFCSILRSVGFSNVTAFPQTFGIATLYIAQKERTSL